MDALRYYLLKIIHILSWWTARHVGVWTVSIITAIGWETCTLMSEYFTQKQSTRF